MGARSISSAAPKLWNGLPKKYAKKSGQRSIFSILSFRRGYAKRRNDVWYGGEYANVSLTQM